MLILYVALKHDYGRPEQGLSFEHHNFYDSLVRMGHTILYFDFMTLLDRRGRDGMNRRLLEVARAERPVLMFTVLFRDELDRETVRRISGEGRTATLNWFCDDHWRFDELTRHWAPCFNWSVTTAGDALPKYERIGVRNVLKSQWACNHFLYRPIPGTPLRHDLAFIGQPHGNRREVIGALRAAGLDVLVRGQGWEEGRVSQEEMIGIFNASRINLNLSNVSTPPAPGRGLAGLTRRAVSATLHRLPGGDRLKRAGRRWFGAGGRAPEVGRFPSQLKGRNFEVPGCGGFLLTDPADGLESCFDVGRDVARFTSLGDLIDKARHYLSHEEERLAVARAGHARTLREHTYVHRFCDIFRAMGLPGGRPEDYLDGRAGAGETVEIQ